MIGLRTHGLRGAFGRGALLAVLGTAVAAGCGRSKSHHPGAGTGTGGGTATGGSGVGAGRGGSGGGGTGNGTGGTDSGGTGTGGSAGTIGEGGGAGSPELCVPAAPLAPMRMLTRFQYDNVVRDVLGDMSQPAQRLEPIDTSTDLAQDGMATASWVEDFHTLAHDFAEASTATSAALAATLGCDVDADGEEACQRRLMDVTLARLFRHPLGTDDLDEFDAVFASGQDQGGDFASGVRMVLEVALQSPELLYRSELGEPLDVPPDDPRAGWRRPTSFEMASRLSFLLWGSAPDEELFMEAAAGGLRTKDEVRAAAERLLADQRSGAVLRYVNLRLLRLLDQSFPAAQDAATNPAFTAQIGDLMRSEMDAFLDDVGASGPGGFERLLTAPYTYANEELAAYYGIPGVTGPELRQVTLTAPPYSGVLTQGTFVATHASATRTIPPARAEAILDAFLCAAVPMHPVPTMLPDDQDGLTTRELYVQTVNMGPTCATCHSALDPVGFTLEHFDQAGRYRDVEVGKPIDAAAEVTLGAQTQGAVDGAADLGRLIASSPEAHACYVSHFEAYAYGSTTEAPLDECSKAQLAEVFERTNGDLHALLLELTQTDAFLYLPPGEP